MSSESFTIESIESAVLVVRTSTGKRMIVISSQIRGFAITGHEHFVELSLSVGSLIAGPGRLVIDTEISQARDERLRILL